MNLAQKKMKKLLAIFVSLAMVIQISFAALAPIAFADEGEEAIDESPAIVADTFIPQPGGANQWYIAGSFQGWDNTGTPFAHLVDEFYALSIVLDAGEHEFKITKDGTWDGFSYEGNNFSLVLEEQTKVNFYINGESNEARINVPGVAGLQQYIPVLNAEEWPRLVGNLQPLFGESEWSPPEAQQYFVDYYFDHTVYKLQRQLPAGKYEAKVIFGNNWEEHENYGDYGGSNLVIDVLDPANVTFSIDYSQEEPVLKHNYVASDSDFDGRIDTSAIEFNSRSATYKKPFGAIAEGQEDLTLRIAAKQDDVQTVKVEVSNQEGIGKTYDMRKITTTGGKDYFEAVIPADHFVGIGVWNYKFILIDGATKVEYGDDGVRGETGRAVDEGALPFELTVYDADFKTPDWMKNAVVYQIFPDRFFDGYEGNNRAKTVDGYRGDRAEDRTGEVINPFPLQYFDGGVENEPTPDQVWGEWSDIPEMPERSTPENAPYFPDSKTDDIWTNEFYGGDIQGVEAKLNYLESIGVTAIYFNPIAWAGSNHKYDATDYKHVDPMFGEPVYNVEGDPTSGLDYKATRIASDKVFIDFAQAARERGIHLIMDGVFNHVGDDSIYFDRYEKYPEIGAYEYWAKVYDHMNANENLTQEEAEQLVIDEFTSTINPSTGTNYKYPEDFEFTTWFTIHNEKVKSRDNIMMYKYDSWWGYDSLPAMDAVEPQPGDSDALDGIHEWNVPSYRNHVIGYNLTNMTEEEQQEAMQFTASQRWNWMGASGWRLDVAPDVSFGTWEKFREAVKTQTGLTNAYGEPIDEPIILGEEWGVATHYLLGNQFDSVMNYRFRGALQSFLNGGNAETMHTALESIREDYPQEAWLVMMNLVGSHDTTRNITKMDFPSYEENRLGIAPDATDRARKLQELTAIFQMGYPGAPTIYYGDEVGLEGTKDPDSRRTFPWERVIENEGQFSGAGKYASLFNVYQRSAEIRNEYELFRTGDLQLAYAEGDVIAYARKGGGKAGLVVINKGEDAADIVANVAGFIPNGVKLTDQLYGEIDATVESGSLLLTIPAMTGLMMVSDEDLVEVPLVENIDAFGGNGVVYLTWDAVAGAEGYNVYRAAIEGGELTLISELTADTYYEDEDVINGMKYYYSVTAVIGSGESANVSMVSATPAFPIGNVEIVGFANDMTVGVGKQTNEISVTVMVYGLTDNAEYENKAAPNLITTLAYYVDGTEPQHATETKLRYKEDLADGAKLYVAAFEPTEIGQFNYFAKASTDNGETYTLSSEASFNAEVDPEAAAPPAAPVLEPITVESNQVRLDWSFEGEEEEIKGFEVWRKQEVSSAFVKVATVPPTAVHYIDYTVSNDTKYEYKIAAFDQYYSRSYSEEQSVTPSLVMVDVTLRLHLPDYTPDQDGIYIAGSFNGWNASGNELKVPSGATNRSIVEYTFKMMAGKSIEYKYTRGTWETEAFTSHARVADDKEDHGNWAYSSTDTNMKLTIRNQGGNKMLINDYVLRWVDMPMMVSMPRISYGDDIEYTAGKDENSFTLKAVVPFGVQFIINGEPISDEEMDQYGNVLVENIALKSGTNTFVLHMEPTEETLNQPWYTDKGRASQATKTLTITIHKEGDSSEPTPKPKPSPSPSEGATVDDSLRAEDELIRSPKPNAAGEVTLKLPANKSRLLIPANAEAISDDNVFIINNEDVEVTISGSLLEQLQGLVSEEALSDAHIVFEAVRLADEDVEELLKKASDKSKANITAAGVIYNFNLSIVGKDGIAKSLTSFDPAIELALALHGAENLALAGIYAIAEDGTLEYIGNKQDGASMKGNALHFSKYGVLYYDKVFTDVSDSYWASTVIKQLAAQGIINGISDTEYAPLRPITRAEFTALIARVLDLKATAAAQFTDVASDSWYADAVAAAYEAGIVNGRTAELFAANDPITREEMAVILIRAYEFKQGSLTEEAKKSSFNDSAQISSWAQNAIDAAVEIGLLKGHSNNTFTPQAHGNRAESAQMIARLIELLN